jgi:hypothetical protein
LIYAFLTCPPNGVVATAKAMPVILTTIEEYDVWAAAGCLGRAYPQIFQADP